MIAVLLCAGYATRMYPLTRDVPKPLLPVAGKPVLEYLLEQMAATGLFEAVQLVTNARFHEQFVAWASTWTEKKLPIIVHNDDTTCNEERLGAAGDLALVLRALEPAPVCVAAGDNIFDCDFAGLCAQFRARGQHCLTAFAEPDRAKLQKTGVLELGPDARVLALHEKPQAPPSTWACPPLYFFMPAVWQQLETFLQTDADHDAPGHFVSYLCRHAPVYALTAMGTRIDIGSIAAYHAADARLRAKKSAGLLGPRLP